jgi:hypothetical protein
MIWGTYPSKGGTVDHYICLLSTGHERLFLNVLLPLPFYVRYCSHNPHRFAKFNTSHTTLTALQSSIPLTQPSPLCKVQYLSHNPHRFAKFNTSHTTLTALQSLIPLTQPSPLCKVYYLSHNPHRFAKFNTSHTTLTALQSSIPLTVQQIRTKS